MDGCIGFEESLVLALKDSWTERDLRRLLIEKGRGEGVRYHSRDCKGEARDKSKKVSSVCDAWFRNISYKIDDKTKEEFFKEESGKPEDRAENSRSEEESEESSCDKVVDEGEANREDEQDDDKDDESQLRGSKHQAARCGLNQGKFICCQRKTYIVKD